MRALTFVPREKGSLAVEDVPEPHPGDGELLVQGLALGICGTDRELVRAEYGTPPPGRGRMIIGHESLGRVLESPPGSAFAPGDLVVGVVRRPDPVPCGACGNGEYDMCRNGRYTECGIKELDGFAAERWTVEEAYAVPVDPELESVGMLVETAAVVAKAWEQIERIGTRAWFRPSTVLVTGAGPVGLLAALFARQRGLKVHVLDRTEEGLKPGLVAGLGATYHASSTLEAFAQDKPDIIVECTGAGQLVIDALTTTAPGGIVCLCGLSSGGRAHRVDAGVINRDIVLENDVVVGTVSANPRHYRAAAAALREADRGWLERLITRRVPLSAALEAFRPSHDVKTVIDLTT